MNITKTARIGGVLYLIVIVLGFLEYIVVKGKIIVEADAAATAANLKSMEFLWRVGITFDLIIVIATTALCLIMYVLLKPVNKNLALLAVLFEIIALAVEAGNSQKLMDVLSPLADPDQIAMLLKSHSQGFGIVLLLFGPVFFTRGYLIFKSGYFPKALGLLFMIPGICYSTSSLMLILAPEIAERLYFMVAGPAVIGELSLALWLLIKGVRMQQWNESI